jgi:hypothetical protein
MSWIADSRTRAGNEVRRDFVSKTQQRRYTVALPRKSGQECSSHCRTRTKNGAILRPRDLADDEIAGMGEVKAHRPALIGSFAGDLGENGVDGETRLDQGWVFLRPRGDGERAAGAIRESGASEHAIEVFIFASQVFGRKRLVSAQPALAPSTLPCPFSPWSKPRYFRDCKADYLIR